MQTIGPYQLVQELGQCPVGGVWSAVDAGNNAATVALLSTAAAHDPGWRNAFAATANSLAQSGEMPLIAGDYSGPIPWIASAARDGAVLGRVFIALGMDFQVADPGANPGEPMPGSVSGGPTGLAATSSPPAASGSAAPVSGAAQPVSGAASEPTAAIATSVSPHQQPAAYGYEASPAGASPYTVSPFSAPPAGPPKRSRAPLIGVLALVLVVLVGGGGALAFILWPDDGEPSVQPPPPTTGPSFDPSQLALVGQWDMDEGSGETANDSSGQGNHASLVNGVGWTSDGRNGTPGVEYDGSAGHLVTEGPVLQTDQSFTVSAWVRLSQESEHNQYVLWQPGTDQSAFALLYRSDGLWGFSVTSFEGGELTWHNLSSTTSPALSEWTHVVGVYDRDQAEIRIYVNGRAEARVEATAQPSVSGFLIGGSGAGRLYGTVDSVHAFQAALTDEQVAGLYEEQVD